MVEVPFGDMDVTPSQGTHFFHNITSLGIGYFTITHSPPSRLDEDWLLGLPPEEDTGLVRHIRFRDPLTVRMDARAARGVILRPDDEEEPGDAAD
jgi:hypothetical protein